MKPPKSTVEQDRQDLKSRAKDLADGFWVKMCLKAFGQEEAVKIVRELVACANKPSYCGLQYKTWSMATYDIDRLVRRARHYLKKRKP